MEMSMEMFERIVGLLAENRVAIQTSENALGQRLDGIQKDLGEIRTTHSLHRASLEALEEDLTEVQKELRSINRALGSQDQALEGLTQLTKTNFNMTESVLKHIHGEAGGIGHGQEEHHEEAEGHPR